MAADQQPRLSPGAVAGDQAEVTPQGPEPNSAEYFCLLYALAGVALGTGLVSALWWMVG
jgi:hypothetical protein